MPDILGALIGTKYADKRREDEYKRQTYGPIVHQYITDPANAIDDGVADYAAKSLMGIMGKDERKNFQAFWDTMKHGRQLSAQQQAAQSTPQQFPSGSPAPQAAAVPQLPAPPADSAPVQTNLGYAGMPSFPPPPSQASADSSLTADAPLPGIDRGGPALGPRVASAPSEGFTALGIGNNPALDAPPPAQEFLRNGGSRGTMRALYPTEMFARDEQPVARSRAALANEISTAALESKRKALQAIPEFNEILPRQQMTLLTGQALTPEVRRNIPGYSMGEEAPPGTKDRNGNPIAAGKFYRIVETETGQQWYPEPAITQKRVVPDQASATGFSEVWEDKQGREISRTPGATPPPAFAPTTTETSSNVTKLVTDAQGNIHAVPVTNTGRTVTQKNALGISVVPAPPGRTGAGAGKPAAIISAPPGATGTATPVATPPVAPVASPQAGAGSPGRIVGARPLSPGQRITFERQMGALDNTLDLAKKVQKNLNLVSSIFDAKIIDLQTDPSTGIIHSIINRSVKLTPQQAEMAGDVASLMEHINTLRGPLGATGFRGGEAWSALQAQRGNLMANPAVTKRVLANTITALTTQRQGLAKGLGLPFEPPPEDTADWRTRAVTAKIGEVIDTPRGRVRKDGPNAFNPVQ